MSRKNAAPRKLAARFVRACAVKMHMEMSQEPCYPKFTRGKTDAPTATPVLCQLAQSKCSWTCHESHFMRKFAGEMPHAPTATSVLREPGQLKCTWTCHKSNFTRKFAGKMPDARPGRGTRSVRACAVETHMAGHVVWRFAGMF